MDSFFPDKHRRVFFQRMDFSVYEDLAFSFDYVDELLARRVRMRRPYDRARLQHDHIAGTVFRKLGALFPDVPLYAAAGIIFTAVSSACMIPIVRLILSSASADPACFLPV